MYNNDSKRLLFEEAITLLPHDQVISTLRQIGVLLIESQQSYDSISEAIKQYGAEKIDVIYKAKKFGIMIIDDQGFLFIQTEKS